MRPTNLNWTRGACTIFGLLLLTAAVCGWSTPARALGIGPYVDLSGGSGEFEYDSDNYDFDVDVGTAAVGLALDTAPISGTNFNYRLNIGVEAQNLEEDYDVTWKLGGLVVENVFCFALARRPNLRWWMGPLVRIGFYSGETDDYYYYPGGDRYKSEADLFEIGIGVVTGFNIKVNRNLILAPSAGIRFISASGETTETNYTAGISYDDDLSGSFSTGFINFALLFE